MSCVAAMRLAPWLCAGLMSVAAQPQAAPVSAEPLGGGLYWLKGGSGANAGLIVGAKESVLVDAKMSPESGKALLDAAAKVTPRPVGAVILTHSDGDHVNGLAGLPEGLRVVAHENARKEMEAAKAPRLPTETFAASRRFPLAGARVELLSWGPAHTSGDVVVFLPDQKVAFVGDLVFVGRDPLIHRQKGGTSFGLTAALKKLLELDADRFIAGHTEVVGKAEIRALLQSIEEKQAKVKALVGQGKSLVEVTAALDPPAAGAAGRRFASLTEVIYREMGPQQ